MAQASPKKLNITFNPIQQPPQRKLSCFKTSGTTKSHRYTKREAPPNQSYPQKHYPSPKKLKPSLLIKVSKEGLNLYLYCCDYSSSSTGLSVVYTFCTSSSSSRRSMSFSTSSRSSPLSSFSTVGVRVNSELLISNPFSSR